MTNSEMKNASGQAGVSVAGREAKATKQNNILVCDTKHINKKCRRLAANGLALRSTASDTQHATLPRVLQFLGAEGLNTYEGTAAGYLRIATRIKELRETWEIHSLREDVFGPDGLFHKGVARYVLIGKRNDAQNQQGSLDLGGQQ
jgi:hypothetical protein